MTAQHNNVNSPPIPGTSPRNSSPVHDEGNLSNNLAKLDLNQSSSQASSGQAFGASTTSNSTCSSAEKLKTDHSNTSSTASSNNNSNNNNEEFCRTSFITGDRRAPGCEKRNSSRILYNHPELTDYEQKKFLATKAMHRKPAGEVRTPNPTWSGLGFSSSMPESMIREVEAAAAAAALNSLSNSDMKESIMEESPLPSSPDETPHHIGANHQRLIRGAGVTNDFGNSSAFEALLQQPKVCSDLQIILPEDDLPSVFARQGLAKYTDLFLRQEIDLRTFATLTDDDFKEIGIQTFGARKKLQLLANKTKQALKDNHHW